MRLENDQSCSNFSIGQLYYTQLELVAIRNDATETKQHYQKRLARERAGSVLRRLLASNRLNKANRDAKQHRIRLLFHRLLANHRQSVLTNQLTTNERRARIRALFARVLASHRCAALQSQCEALEHRLAIVGTSGSVVKRQRAQLLFLRLLYGHRRSVQDRSLEAKNVNFRVAFC